MTKKYPKVKYTPKVCIIGAGFSGLCAAIQLKRKLKLDTFTVYESRYDIGGVWLVNRYPSCQVDIQSHLYSYSFEPNPKYSGYKSIHFCFKESADKNWSSNYASQKEIWAYQKAVAEKYNLYSHIQFNTEVKSTTWDEDLRKWRVVIFEKNANVSTSHFERELTFDIVINCSGSLRVPNIPSEFLSFKGLMTHSGDWNPSITLDETKNVAVIGSGATAAQIIPAIAGKVKALHVYQRKAPWVVPCTQFSFSENVKLIFSYFPILMWIFRCLIFLFNEIHYSALKENTILNKIAPHKIKFHMKKQLKNKEKLLEDVTPNYPFGCNKVIVSSDYHAALALPQVHLHSSPITQVTKDSIFNENGESQKIDILILATGFRPQDFFAPMEIIGKNNENVLHSWKTSGPKMYLGVTSHITPNLYTIYGPNTGNIIVIMMIADGSENSWLQLYSAIFTYCSPGHNSILFMIECQVDMIISVIIEMRRRKCKVANVKSSAEEKYMRELHKKMKTTTWANNSCGSWYANSQGIITTHWPSSCIAYWRKTRKVDASKFEFYY